MTRHSWETFREAGMLWWINRILHTFGWSIIYEINENQEIISVYPAKTDWLGFSSETNDQRWKQFKDHMREDM